MKNKVLFVIVLTVAVAAGAFVYSTWSDKREPTETLMITGNIEAHESVVSFRVEGRIVELPIEEGQFIRKGDLIARLEDDDYRQQVSVDEATVRTRQAELTLALAGSRTQEVKAAKQAVLDAEADLRLKRLEFERRSTEMLKEGAISKEERDAAAAALKRAQAAYERAKQNYDEVVEGTRKEEIDIRRKNLHLAQENLEMSRIRLSYTILRAPTTGVILVRQAELGEVMAPGTPVVTIADLDHIWLRGYVGESDLGRVRWGQPARVQTDTFPGKTYQGRVSFVSSQAEFTPKSVETHKERVTLVYRIKVDLDNPNYELKPGMPADAFLEVPPR